MIELEITPDLIVGHSAGVAIAAQLLLDRKWQIPLIGFTPALMPFPGLAAKIFPSLAKMLFTNPFVAIIFSPNGASPRPDRKIPRARDGFENRRGRREILHAPVQQIGPLRRRDPDDGQLAAGGVGRKVGQSCMRPCCW